VLELKVKPNENAVVSRFKVTSFKILESGLSAFIRQAAQMNMAGHDISC
jgi:hypothetical protein